MAKPQLGQAAKQERGISAGTAFPISPIGLIIRALSHDSSREQEAAGQGTETTESGRARGCSQGGSELLSESHGQSHGQRTGPAGEKAAGQEEGKPKATVNETAMSATWEIGCLKQSAAKGQYADHWDGKLMSSDNS